MCDWSVYSHKSLRQSAAVHSCFYGVATKQPARQNFLMGLFLSLSHVPRNVARATLSNRCKPEATYACQKDPCSCFRGTGHYRVGRNGVSAGECQGLQPEFSACHSQVLWRVRSDSQARFYWHVRDLQLSAGEICTAESAGGGKRTDIEVRLIGNQGKWTGGWRGAGKWTT